MLKKAEKRVWPNWPSLCFEEIGGLFSRVLDRVSCKDPFFSTFLAQKAKKVSSKDP